MTGNIKETIDRLRRVLVLEEWQEVPRVDPGR